MLKVHASIISSKLKAQRANLNKLDRLPPGRILRNSANSFFIELCQVNGQQINSYEFRVMKTIAQGSKLKAPACQSLVRRAGNAQSECVKA